MVRKRNVTWGSTPCNSASDTASSEMRICELHVTLTRCTTVRIHISGCYTQHAWRHTHWRHHLTFLRDGTPSLISILSLSVRRVASPCALPRHIGFSLHPSPRRQPIPTSHESWQVSITFLISTAWFRAYWLNTGLLSPPTTLLTAGASDWLPLRYPASDVVVQKVANLLRLWTSRDQVSPQTVFLIAL